MAGSRAGCREDPRSGNNAGEESAEIPNHTGRFRRPKKEICFQHHLHSNAFNELPEHLPEQKSDPKYPNSSHYPFCYWHVVLFPSANVLVMKGRPFSSIYCCLIRWGWSFNIAALESWVSLWLIVRNS